ncbi:ABC transporter substrate-binding protein [Streptomyces sp. NBC_01261]|uniref:ABC transporter substrate-binding protein n=1 Tax=Streptomyces sp. NBC_01261 TaxID=2903802 RepID=UPI002E339C33|nr:ABC transporter substrate-binding protein [Streptomyces sp. NBC_01261]
MPTAEAASAFISTFLTDFARVPESARAAFIASVLDWRELAPIAVGPGWEQLSDEQSEAVLDAMTDHVAARVADLPLADADLVITDTDPHDSGKFRVMTSALVDEEATEITFWVFEVPGNGLRVGNVGVEGVSFLGRLRPQLTAIVKSQGIDAAVREMSAMVGQK